MGLSCMGNYSVYPEQETKIVFAPNPNPAKFKIVVADQVGKNVVAQIEYPNCTNFEGMKVCVFKDMDVARLKKLDSIDPHFSEKGIAPFARFEPTADGYNAALWLAGGLQ